jgi:hypothetical protein
METDGSTSSKMKKRNNTRTEKVAKVWNQIWPAFIDYILFQLWFPVSKFLFMVSHHKLGWLLVDAFNILLLDIFLEYDLFWFVLNLNNYYAIFIIFCDCKLFPLLVLLIINPDPLPHSNRWIIYFQHGIFLTFLDQLFITLFFYLLWIILIFSSQR